MKKIVLATLMVTSMLICMGVFAEGNEVTFEAAEGGQFIYCNNQEALLNTNLMNGEVPMYLMNNENLAPDRYILYISHINYTGPGYGTGFDVELDVELTAVEDSVITIDNASFETPEVYGYTQNGSFYRYEGEWGCFQVCCDMLGVPMVSLDGKHSYVPRSFEPVTLEVKKGETVFLSEYLQDYSVVHYGRPVHIQADITVDSGKMNFNVGALKHNGTLKDRSEWDFGAAFGKYFRDRCSKGIAYSLPKTVAKLEYTINDETPLKLPVTVKNQYHPEGTELDCWVTNINPQNDIWTKYSAAESNMLPLYYKDPSKLEWYGEEVPEEEKDDVWVFDVYHSDTNRYSPAYGSAATYKPNFVLDVKKDNLESSCCLGNYGVAVSYEITVTNESEKDKYIGLDVTTASAIIGYTYGETVEKAFVKNWNTVKETAVMCEEIIPAGETKTVCFATILPVNYNGGTMNELVVSDTPRFVCLPSESREKTDILNGVLLSKSPLAESELDIFEGNRNSYSYLAGKENALVRWCAWDGKPSYYYNLWNRCNFVYIFDKSGEVVSKTEFTPFPCRASWDGDRYFVELADGTVWASTDGNEWEQYNGGIPAYTPYYDLENASFWAVDLLETGYEEKIRLKPFEDGSYGFSEEITRLDFCKLAAQYLERFDKMNPSAPFADTSDPDILMLAGNGIILGFEDGTFRPHEKITREQAAVILQRFLNFVSQSIESDSYLYSDDELISDWAKPATALMHSTGIMIGGYDNTFMPQDFYTREQAVVTVMRMKAYAEQINAEKAETSDEETEIAEE